MKNIEELRREIDEVNKKIVELLAQRMKIAEEIARYKKLHGLPIQVPEREKEVIESVKKLAREIGLEEKAAEEIFWKIIEQTRRREYENSRTGSGWNVQS